MALTFEQYKTLRQKGFTQDAVSKMGTNAEPFVSKLDQSEKSLGGFASNVVKSGAGVVSGLAQAITHPVDTAVALGKTALGGVEKLIPGEQGQEQSFDAVVDFYKQRYGGIENLKKTFYEDPIGVLSDLSIILGGGGAALKGAGTVSKIGGLSRTGQIVSDIGKAVDPTRAAIKGAGVISEAVTTGRKVEPFASKINQPATQAASELGIELPASMKSISPVVRGAEALASKGIFGGGIADKVGEVQTKLQTIADDLIKSTNQSSDLSLVGRQIEQGVSKYKAAYQATKNDLYKSAQLPTDIPVKPQNTINLLDDLIAKERQALKASGQATSNELTRYTQLRQGLSNRKLTTADADAALGKLNRDINFGDFIQTGDKGALRKIAASLSDELDTTLREQLQKRGRTDLIAAHDQADAFYKEGLNRLQSDYADKIFKFKDQPDKILPSIINPATSIEDVPKIYQVVGKDAQAGIQSAFIDKVIKDSKGVQGTFTPGGLEVQIKKFGDKKLQAILEPYQYRALKNINEITKSLGGVQKIAEGSQTAFLVRLSSEIGTLFVNPILGFKLLLGDALFSKFVSSDFGQKLMTSGLTLKGGVGKKLQEIAPMVSEAVKVGRGANIVREEVNP